MLLHVQPKVEGVLGSFALEEEVEAVQVDGRACTCALHEDTYQLLACASRSKPIWPIGTHCDGGLLRAKAGGCGRWADCARPGSP
jgi:hypothetical protein